MLITAGISQQPPCLLQQWPHYHHTHTTTFQTWIHTCHRKSKQTAKAVNTLMKNSYVHIEHHYRMLCSSHERFFFLKRRSKKGRSALWVLLIQSIINLVSFADARWDVCLLPASFHTWAKTGRGSCRATNRARVEDIWRQEWGKTQRGRRNEQEPNLKVSGHEVEIHQSNVHAHFSCMFWKFKTNNQLNVIKVLKELLQVVTSCHKATQTDKSVSAYITVLWMTGLVCVMYTANMLLTCMMCLNIRRQKATQDVCVSLMFTVLLLPFYS